MQHRAPWLAALAALGGATAGPQPTGLVEEVGRELVQIEVRVDGPAAMLAALGPEEFEVVVGGRAIERFALDRSCAGESAARPAPATVAGATAPAAVSAHRTSYLFYFDQHQLTIDGRAHAIEAARRLVPEVLRDGGRARIVSAGLRLESVCDWTSDATELLVALDRLERDPAQVDSYPALEDQRVVQLLRAFETRLDLADGAGQLDAARIRAGGGAAAWLQDLGLGGFGDVVREQALGAIHDKVVRAHQAAMAIARVEQREERSHARGALERFALALGSLGPIAPPKAVIYFADTVRANAGDHYVQMFAAPENELPQLGGVLPAFDEVIRAAAAYGVRLYTIQAAGLTVETTSAGLAGRATQFSGGALATSRRFEDAKSALVTLAAETGGRAFLHGASVATIARRLQEDLGCLFLISFGPGSLPRDRPLGLRVVARAPGVRVAARPTIVVRGDATRRRERLAQAFVDPAPGAGGDGLRVAVIPTGADADGYSALVQIAVPPARGTAATWDVGMTLVVDSGVRDEATGRASVDRAGIPLIYEAEMRFPPGPFELIAVAEDTLSGSVESVRAAGRWPELEGARAGFGPLTVIQPARAAFVRGAAVRSRGSRGVDEREALDPGRPTALVGIACGVGEFSVERRVVGESAADFATIRSAAGERCALFHDLVPEGVLGAGDFVYEAVVRARRDGATLASAERRFVVLPAQGRADEQAP